MKRIIMLTIVLVMMLVSLGGCFVGYDGHGRGGADLAVVEGMMAEDLAGAEDLITEAADLAVVVETNNNGIRNKGE